MVTGDELPHRPNSKNQVREENLQNWPNWYRIVLISERHDFVFTAMNVIGSRIHSYLPQVSDVYRTTTGGFNRGNLTVEGSGEFTNQTLLVDFQNENLVAKRVTPEGKSEVSSILSFNSLVNIFECIGKWLVSLSIPYSSVVNVIKLNRKQYISLIIPYTFIVNKMIAKITVMRCVDFSLYSLS